MLEGLKYLVGCPVLVIKEPVGGPEGKTIDKYDPSGDGLGAKVKGFLDVCPFGSPTFLMPTDTLLEFFVPDTGGSQIDRVGGEAKGKLLSILAFARTLSASDENDLGHGAVIILLQIYANILELTKSFGIFAIAKR